MLELLEQRRMLLVVLAAALLVSALVVGAISRGPPRAIVFEPASTLEDGAPIRVHIAGEVVRPGVYEMYQGERVIDAIAAAGGATTNADASALNLARRLRDGERLEVPARSSRTSAAAAPHLVSAGPIDINTATAAELDRLPGIGAAYSRRIVDSRTVDGPYRSIEELVTRRVLPASTFEGIRELITAGP